MWLAPTQGILGPKNAFFMGFIAVFFSPLESTVVFAAAFILLACLPQALGRGNATSQKPGVIYLVV